MGFPIIFTSVSSNGASVTDEIMKLLIVSPAGFNCVTVKGKNLLDDCPPVQKIIVPIVV